MSSMVYRNLIGADDQKVVFYKNIIGADDKKAVFYKNLIGYSTGCHGVGCVVGAEALSGASGVWVKTRFYREGNFLCATVYSVSAGEPKVVELRVDLRPIARALVRAHSVLHSKEAVRSGAGVGTVGWSLGSMWKGVKKAAKAIGRTKLVKGVTGTVMNIARSKAFQIAMPAMALAMHTSSRATGGKGVFKGALGKAVDMGTAGVLSAAPGGGSAASVLTSQFSTDAIGAYAAANTAIAGVEAGSKAVKTARVAASTIVKGVRLAKTVSSMTKETSAVVARAGAVMNTTQRARVEAAARAAGQLKLTPQGKTAIATALARVPAGPARAMLAQRVVGQLGRLSKLRTTAVLAHGLPKAAGVSVAQTTSLQVKAAPMLSLAARTAKSFRNPAVRKRMLDIRARGDRAQAVLEGVKQRALTATGTAKLDAQKSAMIVNLVARNRARIQAMAQANAGGMPGVLITPEGRLFRGRFKVQAKAGGQGFLYQGRGKGSRGAFSSVSGGQLDHGSGPPGPWRGFGEGEVSATRVNGVDGQSIISSFLVSGSKDGAGDLPINGTRLSGKGANAHDIGNYDVQGSGDHVSDVRSPTRTEVRSPTRTEVRSPTRTATEVRSPTSTSTDAYTQGNFTATVTGGAGAGATEVHIHAAPLPYSRDSRGRKQLAKTAMDVDTTGPASSANEEMDVGNYDVEGWGISDDAEVGYHLDRFML